MNQKVQSHAEPTTNTWRRLTQATANLLLWLMAITSVGTATYVLTQHIHFARVLSDSMAPKFNHGDLLIVKPIPVAEIKPNFIAMLPAIKGDGTLFTHRIQSVYHKNGVTLVRTKGDANPAADPEVLRITSPTVPIVLSTVNLTWFPAASGGQAPVVALFGLLLILVASIFIPTGKYKEGSHRGESSPKDSAR